MALNGEISLFSKKVYCECCGKSFIKNRANLKNGKKEYLHCKSGRHACGNNTSIDLEVFTEYITSNITEQINKYYSATSISKEYYAQNVYQN